MFASDNHPTVPRQNVGLAEEQQWRKDLLCFYWRRRLSAALVRYAAALLCWRHSCLSERVRYLIFRHSQRNTHSPRRLNRPVKPNCARGNLSPPLHPPTRNDHLSLARINEDDRWGRSASLTEAPRQGSSTNCWNGPDPVEYITQVNSGWVGYVRNDKSFKTNWISLEELWFEAFACRGKFPSQRETSNHLRIFC